MGKYSQILRENKVVSANRLQRLAGLIREQEEVESKLESTVKTLVRNWLSKEGTQKIYEDMVKSLEEYYASGQHEDVDEDGHHYIPPSEEKYANGETLLDQFLNDILAAVPDSDLKTTLLEGEAPPELYSAMAQELEMEARKMFEEADDEAEENAGDQRAYEKDPYAYYGVRRSDFY